MSDLSDKVKDQVEQLVKASRGLAIKLKEESNKQYQELVELGEKSQDDEDKLVIQFRKFLEESFKDIKGSSKQVRLASLGLATRVRDNSESIFNELVELGTPEEKEEEATAN